MADSTARGRVKSIVDTAVGDTLDADIPAGSNELIVGDAAVFDEEVNGLVRVGEEVLEYSGIDDDRDVVLLVTGTTVDHTRGEQVILLPETTEKTAIVILPGGVEIPDIRIPHRDHPYFPAGQRDPEERERVLLRHVGGDYVYEDMWGVPKRIAGTAIDGPLPNAELSDGLAPAVAPTITAEPFAVAAAQVNVTFDPASNKDAVTFEVAASLAPGVPEDGTGIVKRSSASRITIQTVGGAAIPMGATVYFKVRATDVDGAGPWSAEASTETRSADAFITAAFIAALEIEAQQIKSGELDATLGILGRLLVGDRAEWDGDTSVLTIFARNLDSQGNKIPVIRLDPDGSEFRGRVIADDISVLNGLILIGTNSEISSGAGMWLGNGVANPTSQPQATLSTQQLPFPAPPTGMRPVGLAWDTIASEWLRFIKPSSGSVQGTSKVERINAAGTAVLATTTMANIPNIGEDDFNGIHRITGTQYLTSWYDSYGSGDYGIAMFSTAGASTLLKYMPGNTGRSIVGWDSVNSNGIYAAMQSETAFVERYLSVHFIDPGGAEVEYHSLTWPVGATANLTYIGRGSFDYGAERLVIATEDTAYVWVKSGGEYVRDSAKDFPLASGAKYLAWRPSVGFHSIGLAGDMQKYGPHTASAATHFHVAYVDGDGTSLTAPSPIRSTALVKRRYIYVQLPPPPSGVTTQRVYGIAGTSTVPAITTLRRRPETVTPTRALTVDPTVAGSTEAPPTSSTFPSGAPGWLQSRAGGAYFRGNGSVGSSRTPSEGTDFISKDYFEANAGQSGPLVALPYATGMVRRSFGTDLTAYVDGSSIQMNGTVSRVNPSTGASVNFPLNDWLNVTTLPVAMRPQAGAEQFFPVTFSAGRIFGGCRVNPTTGAVDVILIGSTSSDYVSLDTIRISLKARRS